jgi:hypothetical protein
MADLIILPAVIIGAVIGFYELMLIHQDENFRGSHWLIHGLQAAIFCIVFVFATMNVDYVVELIPALQNWGFFGTPLMIRLIIGVIAIFRIQASSAVVRGHTGMGSGLAARGLKEHFVHTFIVAALIVAAPYVYNTFLINIIPSGITSP